MCTKKYLFLIFLLLITLTSAAQKGAISGVVRDKKTNETIIGANVVLQGTTIGASTDLDGNFTISNLAPGTYNLLVSFISYKTHMVEKVKVNAGETKSLNIAIEETSTSIAGVTITAQRATGTDVSVLSSIRKSEILVSGISHQQIARSQDRDASEVIRRVPGITIIDGRFVMVRGLSERYNSVWINNATTPSSETDVKAFGFDMIPAGMLDQLMVFKTPAANLPADFAGASIQLSTKNTAEENSINVAYSSSYRAGTTFRDFYAYKGGKYDWLGFDDGSRSLPDDFPGVKAFTNLVVNSEKQKLAELGRSLNKNWTSELQQAPVDHRFSLGFNRRFLIGRTSLGNITSVNYSNTFTNYSVHRASYQGFEFDTQKINYEMDFNDKQYTNTAKFGVMHNWNFIYGNNQRLEFRNLFNQIGFTRTNQREGKTYYVGGDGRTERSYEMRYNARNTLSSQLGGSNTFLNESIKINYTLGFAKARRNEPDVKRLTTYLNEDKDSQYYGQYAANFSFAANPALSGRLFSEVEEDVRVAAFNYEQKLFLGSFIPEIRAGVFSEKKYRTFATRLLGYRIATTSKFNWSMPYWTTEQMFADSSINPVWGIILDEKTNASDSYESENDLLAAYFSVKIPLGAFSLIGGIRVEKNRQTLNSFQKDDPTKPVNYENDTINYFPSTALIFNINEKSLLRAGYGLTINRPEFREIAPMSFYDFDLRASIFGNDTLMNAYIHNYDLRYEFYPTAAEMFTLGVFYKSFIHPIETYYFPSGSGLSYTFGNAEAATSLGAELEYRYSFKRFKEKTSFIKYLRDFNIVFNTALINSRVNFTDAQMENDRPMQGQSPYIINAGVFYNNEKYGLMLSAMYLVIGKRIIYVGDVFTGNPDVYELQRHTLDITFSKNIGKYLQIKGGIQDVLNNPVVYEQTYTNPADGAKKNLQTLYYKMGSYYTLGITVKL